MENLLLATEIIKDYHKEDVIDCCAMKVDISKAFDTVQWPVFLNVLKDLDIPDKYDHWINLCISTASFSVQVNGELAGFFPNAISLDKSTIYVDGITNEMKEDILTDFPFEYGTLPVRYLGLPLLTKKMRAVDFAPLIEKIKLQISTWTARQLCFAGPDLKTTKAKVSWKVVCTPKEEGGPDLKTTKAKVSWKVVCTPKEEGELGVSDQTSLREVMERDMTRIHRNSLFNQVEQEILMLKEQRVHGKEDEFLWRLKDDTYSDRFLSKETWQILRGSYPVWEDHRGWLFLLCGTEGDTRTLILRLSILKENMGSVGGEPNEFLIYVGMDKIFKPNLSGCKD
nr:hypothetical protein [Tanacetum cinerariifolium]